MRHRTETEIETQQREQHLSHVSGLVKDFLEPIVREFMVKPEQLEVAVGVSAGLVGVEMRASGEDTGKLVGRNGAMFESVRQVLLQLAALHGVRLHYSVQDSGDKKVRFMAPPLPTPPEQAKAKVEKLLAASMARLFEHPVEIAWTHTEDASRAFVTLDTREEELVPRFTLRDSLSRLFMAVGRYHGRSVFVERLERRAA